MWPFSACATTLNALPSNRFTRYDQPSSSTHTNSSSSILHESESNKDDFDGGGNVGDKFNNTIHLLDFLSKKLILNDANNNSMKLTFEETMANLDSLIAELDQDLRLQAQSGGSLAKLPRLDGANAENLEKYEALLELKEILDRQFREFSLNEEGLKAIDDAIVTENDYEVETPGESKSSSYLISNGKVTEDHLLSDEERLKIPLIGNPKADPSQLPLNEDALNLLVKDGSPGVAIYPMSEQKKVKENITALTGLDFDELIQNVSDSVGKVEFPIKVEEHHTQVTEEAGKRPYYKYTETIADVDPNHVNSRDPHVNIVSKRMEEGDLLSTEPKQKYRWSGPNPGITATGQVVSDPIRNFAPTLEQIAQSASGQNNDDVKVNVTTKTNIVNVFTFNIYVNNGTSGGQDYQLVKDQPFRSSIETTAEIDAPTPNSEPTKSFSLYQYDASGTSSDMAKEEKKAEEGAELEKWLKILLNHQAYGDGSNIVAEAVLKDSSLQQIPEPSNSLYRMVDEVPSPISSSTPPSIGMLGYKTDSNGELINPGLSTNGNSKIESKTDKTLMETLTGSPIPTIIAGIAAISPFFLAGGKKRRRRKRDVTSVEIPDQWLSYLLGTRYSGAPTTTPKPVSLEYQYEPPLAAKEIHHHHRPTTTTTNVPSTTTTTTTKKSTIFPSSTTSMSSTTTTDFSPTSKSEPTSRTLFVPLYSSTSERPPFPETSLTRTLVRKSEASPSVQISKVRNDDGGEDLEELNRKEPKLERRDPNAPDVSSLLKHWASLYSSAKGSQTTTSSTTRKPINYELYFPASKVTSTTPVTTLSTSESTTTPSLPTSTTTARTFSSSTAAASTENNAIDFNDSINELKDKWSLMTSFNTKLDTLSPFKKKAGYFANGNPVRIIDEAVSVSTSTSTEVNIVPVDAALEKEDDKFVPYYPTLTNSQKKQELPTKPSDGRIKSQNVDPGLWLTAKDILNNLGSKLITESNEEESVSGQKNNDMTNSPIVIIPVEDFNDNPPPVNVQALKPLVSRNPITFINMNNVRPAYKPSTANIEKLSEPPSKQYMESIWSKYNQRFKNQSKPEFVKKESLIKTASKNNIVQISHFPIETTTIGIRRPPWDGANDPNSGVGTIEELQVPPSINIQSGVINTDLTPEVLNQLRTKLGESDEDTDDGEESNDIDVEPIYVQAPLSSPNIDNYYALMSSSPTILNNIKESILGLKNFVENGEINDAIIDGGGIEEDDYAPLNSPKDYEYLSSTEKIEIEDLDLAGSVSSEDYAPLSKPDQDVPASYEVYDPLSSEDNSELLESLKLQLQNSPLTHALHKGQWVYESQYYTQEEPSPITPQKLVQKVTESTPIYGTKNAFHNGQLLEWIKNLEKDIEPTRRNPITIRTTTASTSDVTSTRSTTQSSSVTTLSTVTTSASSNANNKTVDTRLSLNVVQPLSSVTTASPVISSSTANDESPKTIGEIVASALAQSAAPLAGLSAATLAYGAAAMLPVWLPLALGRKRKRRKRRRAERLPTNYDAYSILSKLGSLDN